MLFLILAALAVNSSCATQPPLPLSPANLPAQFPPKVGDIPHFCSTNARLKGLDEDYRHKALSVLSGLEGIQYVEIAPEGVVWGYTESVLWAALILPCGTECIIHLIHASWSRIDEDVYDEMMKISEKIINTKRDSKFAPRKIGKRNIELERKLPVIFWHIDSRKVNSVTNHYQNFGNVAALFMEKYGYDTAIRPCPMSYAATFGNKDSEKPQALSATMLEQEKVKSVYFIFIGVAIDDESASKDVKCIVRDLMKLFYE